MAMTHSEFWSVMERVFPEGRARSLAQDLALPELELMTPNDALARGIEPVIIWQEIVKEMNLPPNYRYAHRFNSRDFPH